jgi:hypothetical protein
MSFPTNSNVLLNLNLQILSLLAQQNPPPLVNTIVSGNIFPSSIGTQYAAYATANFSSMIPITIESVASVLYVRNLGTVPVLVRMQFDFAPTSAGPVTNEIVLIQNGVFLFFNPALQNVLNPNYGSPTTQDTGISEIEIGSISSAIGIFEYLAAG